MQFRLMSVATLAAVALFAGVACSDNDGDGDTTPGADATSTTGTASPTETPEDSLSEAIAALQVGDLDVLVLPPEELGILGRGLETSPESGPVDNAAAAENSIDVDETEADVEERGRLGGYSINYDNPSPGGDSDVVAITSSVSLYESADSATTSLDKGIQDFFDAEGQRVAGISIVAVEEFEVEDLGDEARGIFVEMESSEVGTLFATSVFTRVESLGLTTAVLSLDDVDIESQVAQLSERHVNWVTQVVTGEIDPSPVPIPEAPTPSPTRAPDGGTPPADTPPLDQVTIQLADLPEGFVESEAGFDTVDPAGEYDYTRAFEASGDWVEVGGSRIASIENNVIVFGSLVEGRAFVSVVAGLFEGAEGEAFFRNLLEAEGLTVTDLTTERQDIDLGDETVVVIATAETPQQSVSTSFLLSRTGRVVSAMIVVGDADGFDVDDITPLQELAFMRLVESGIE